MQNRFTKIYVYTLLTLFFVTAGCTVKYIDTVTIFEIKGEVYDNETQAPVENVAVRFMDTGYDVVRSKRPFFITIGNSKADGKFLARLNYVWRQKDAALHNPPPKTFEVELTHKDYEPRRFHFDESHIKQGELRLEINLDRVYLLPKK